MGGRLKFLPLDYASAAGFLVYSASAAITPICLVMIAGELNFDLSAGGWLEGMRSLLIVCMLLMSGFLALRFGMARSLGWSFLLLGVGLWLYALAPVYGLVLIALALLGVGGGVMEALLNPLIQELHPNDSGRYLNIANGFFSIGVLVTVLFGGEILTRGYSWRWIIAGLGVLSVGTGLLFLYFRTHGNRPLPNARIRDVWARKREVLRAPGFRAFSVMMFFGAAAEGAFLFWTASLIQVDFGGTPRVAGWGTAMFAAGMIVGRFGMGFAVSQARLPGFIFGSAIAGLLVSAAIPLAPGLPLLFGGLLLAGLTTACFWPSVQSYAAEKMRVDATALFILLSCVAIPGFGLAPVLIGLLAGKVGFQAAFGVIPVFFLGIVIALWAHRRDVFQSQTLCAPDELHQSHSDNPARLDRRCRRLGKTVAFR